MHTVVTQEVEDTRQSKQQQRRAAKTWDAAKVPKERTTQELQLWKLQAAELGRVLKREVEPAKTSRQNSAVERKACDANESD